MSLFTLFLQDHEDFEFKKLLFDTVLVLSKDSSALPVRYQSKFPRII